MMGSFRERNEHTKKNCAPSWLYLQDYTGLHGQQNTQKHVIDYGPFNWLSFIAHSTGTFVQFRNTSYL